MKSKTLIRFSLIIFISTLYSCSTQTIHKFNDEKVKPSVINEADIIPIPLSGEVSKRSSEISGLCWYGDKLILLPQYPNIFGNGSGKIFYTKKSEIINFLSGESKMPITPKYFSIDLTNFKDLFSLGSGFESIVFNQDTVYFTIESMNDGKTETILISGKIDTTSGIITLDENSLVKDPTKMFINNISDESILYYQNKIIPIYEVYGKNLNSDPKVSIFSNNLKFIKKISFPNIEYRITDVTSVDDSGNFWAINYFYPGDNQKLKPATDSIIIDYGIGKSHLEAETVERLLEFQIKENEIVLANRPPIYLKLMKNENRNWEGIARFNDEGFLVITDTFPQTIFALVRVPKQ